MSFVPALYQSPVIRDQLAELERRNGATPNGIAEKVCRVRSETKPTAAFERNRGTCRSCRGQQGRDRERRDRATPAADDGPPTAASFA